MIMDPDLLRYLPHRPPMLLVDKLMMVRNNQAETRIEIKISSSFYVEGKGVPAWIGIEYMGQTAATIAGYQLNSGALEPHLGLLLGTRKYHAEVEWFELGDTLSVRCKEQGAMQGTLATFQCEIVRINSAIDVIPEEGNVLATANLTVYRAPAGGATIEVTD